MIETSIHINDNEKGVQMINCTGNEYKSYISPL